MYYRYHVTYSLDRGAKKTVLFETAKRKHDTVFMAFCESLPEYLAGGVTVNVHEIKRVAKVKVTTI